MGLVERSTRPLSGSVLGIDVGFSPIRRSSAVCRLDWDQGHYCWSIRRFRAIPAERSAAIAAAVDGRRLEAAAFDGPLCSGFEVIGRYRLAEKMLTARFGRKIGKPGQSNTPVGRKLNEASNDCVRTVLATASVAPATHLCAIDRHAVVEAFPTAFLGMLVDKPTEVPATRANRSDVYFMHLAASGVLARLMRHLLPGRETKNVLQAVTDHDERAALVCAITALCVASGDFSAVGDQDGWVILPPWTLLTSWAQEDLIKNGTCANTLYYSGFLP